MNLDFSSENERDQTFTVSGPVPQDSMVWIRITALPEPRYGAPQLPGASAARTGLLSARYEAEVSRGEYTGWKIYYNVWLPAQLQEIGLTPGQRKACSTCGAQIKAICQVCGRSPKLESLYDLVGCEFPVLVDIEQYEKDGQVRYKNVIRRVILRDDQYFPELARTGEILTEKIYRNPPMQAQDYEDQGYAQSSGYQGQGYSQPTQQSYQGSSEHAMPGQSDAIDSVPF